MREMGKENLVSLVKLSFKRKVVGKAFLSKKRFVDKDEHVDKEKGIDEKMKGKLEPAHKGEFVAIGVDTGDYFVGKDVIEADRKAREKYPDAVFYLARIGYRAAWHFR